MPKSKSAYSVAGKQGKLATHTFVVWVDNEAGVLARVVGLFSGRGYNIESLAVAEVDQKNNLSRITIVTTGTPEVIEQIVLQLKKLVPVHKVGNFKREDKNVIFKEMALFKVIGNSAKIKKALNACKKYNPVILDQTNKSAVIQITALRREIDIVTKNLKRLNKKICLVTGAGRGIGKNIARALGREGCLLALTDIDANVLAQVKEEFLSEGFSTEIFLADLALSGEPSRLVERIVEKFGKLDVIVNNARAGQRSSFEEESEENWDLAFDVNLKAVFFLTQAAVPFMASDGCIVTIGSVSGALVSQESPSYQISKAGLLQLNRYLAVYMGDRGIRVNTILPRYLGAK